MFFVAAHDEIGFRRQRAFLNHFVVGIRRCTRRAFNRKNQFGGFGQGFHPLYTFATGIIQTQFLNGFVIFGQQAGTDHGHAPALRPRRQTIKRRTPPKAGTGNDLGVENDFHALTRRRTRCTAAATVVSSFAVISGRRDHRAATTAPVLA